MDSSSKSEVNPRTMRRAGGRRPAVELEDQVGKIQEPKRRTLTAKQYNEMWRAYAERQTVEHVAKATGLNVRLVRRYVSGRGDPNRGMEPIKKRWLRVQSQAQAEEELTLVQFRREQMKLVQGAIKAASEELLLMREDIRRRIKAYKDSEGKASPVVGTSLDKLTQSIDRMVRLGERILGGPDQIKENRVGIDRFENWTIEELVEYSTTGRVPDHDRSDMMTVNAEAE